MRCQLGLCSHTCAFTPHCASPLAGLGFHLSLVSSACVLQAGLSLQALASDMPSGITSISYLLSSAFFPLLPSLSPPQKANTSRQWIPKVFICLCWNFEISNIYLNKVGHNLGITVMGLFVSITSIKKPVFYCVRL